MAVSGLSLDSDVNEARTSDQCDSWCMCHYQTQHLLLLHYYSWEDGSCMILSTKASECKLQLCHSHEKLTYRAAVNISVHISPVLILSKIASVSVAVSRSHTKVGGSILTTVATHNTY